MKHAKPPRAGRRNARLAHVPRHPEAVATLPAADDATPDQPFAEGAADALDPDLRHRLISETAFHRRAERGFEDGSEVEDWSEAEADVDHTLLNPPAVDSRGR